MIEKARQRIRGLESRLAAEAQRLKVRRTGGQPRRELDLFEELGGSNRRAEQELALSGPGGEGRSAAVRRRMARTGIRVVDELRFLRRWAANPLRTGAVAPSGAELSRLMAGYVELDRPGVVVELGPGTGVVTQKLIDRGVPPERLVLIEYSGEFCDLLRRRFPGVTVVHGNAYALGEVMDSLGNPPIASVVSGLPLFTRPLPERQALFTDAMRRMSPGAPFIQFSYALVPAVKGLVGITWSTSRWVVANLPPARVWAYRATNGVVAA